jgi:hypothetical protein
MTNLHELIPSQPVSKVRRNHALEHAALHVLARQHKTVRMGGHSDLHGFRIIGNLPTEDVQQAVDEALMRLQNGERNLAYHPNCGTNYAALGTAVGLAAWTGTLGSGKSLFSKLLRLPLVILLGTLALIYARPLGPYLQRNVTTDPAVGSLHVVGIQRHDFGSLVYHRVLTRD